MSAPAGVSDHVFLDATTCTLYLDTSGDSLFKRGRRDFVGEAPGANEDAITEAAIDAGADDVVVYPEDGAIDVLTAPENFQAVKDAMAFSFGREPVFVREGGSIGAVVSMAALPAIGAPAASAPGEPRASATVDAAVGLAPVPGSVRHVTQPV